MVFSYYQTSSILISDLVVPNLFVYAFTSRYNSTLLGQSFITLKVFLHEFIISGEVLGGFTGFQKLLKLIELISQYTLIKQSRLWIIFL